VNEELPGGNMNSVVRVGATVRRRAGSWTPTIHCYLRHLGAVGISWIPRPLAIEGDREFLSFVEGDVPLYPLPDWVWSDEALVDAARHLRMLHDASVDFDREGAIWQLPTHEPVEVICHNDFAPHNLAFEGGRVVGVIDFDTSSPGPRIWDIAYLATRMVPLTADHPENAPDSEQVDRRLELLLGTYGSDASPADVIAVAIIRLRDIAEFSRSKAIELGKPHLREDAALYERDASHLERRS
jgi:aminoglycoside phosphotransferase (APT) family kinase protein